MRALTRKCKFKNCKTDAVIIRILTDVSAMLPSLGYTRLNTVKKFVKISSRAWWHTSARATWNSALRRASKQNKKKAGRGGGVIHVKLKSWWKLADRFREHRRDIINRRNDLPAPAHFNQPNHTLEDMKDAVLKAGLANQEYRKKQEMRLIF